MTSTDQFLVYFAFVQMLTCAALLLPLCLKNRSILLFTLLLLCACGYHLDNIFGPFTSMSTMWWLDYIASNALPGVFWLVSLSIFTDHKELKSWQYLLASLTLQIPLFSTLAQLLINFDLRQFPAFFGLVTYGALALELVLICYAMVIALRHWQADLVQERRYMRGSVMALTGIYIFSVIVVEQLFNLNWQWLATIEYMLLSLLMAGINFMLFSLRDGTLFDPQKISVQAKPQDNQPSPELQRILDAMNLEKLYRKEGITISGLSRHLGIHEYRLRKLINGELAYRNFNDFLNFFRIQEVTEKLSKPQHSKLPVLTIALDSGFCSLSSFNKAFKNLHGITPTEFRQNAQSNGAKANTP
jgi:AraC-like DNA-binding protein